MTFIEYVTNKMNNWIEHAQESRDDLIERLNKDPFHALEWMHGDFQIQARGKVAEIIIANLEQGHPIDRLKDYALKEALRAAQFPQSSTSITSNECHRRLGSAWAELVEILNEV